MAAEKLTRRRSQEREHGPVAIRPPPPPFAQPVHTPSSAKNNATSSSTVSHKKQSPHSTVLSRTNCGASSFAPPPFAPIPSSAPSPCSSQRNPPPPPPRKSNTSHAATVVPASTSSIRGHRAHEIIRVTLQRPMGIVFALNEQSGHGVRIIDLPHQGAAAMSQQLRVGDALVSVNEVDCTMWSSKEVLTLIGKAEGNIELAFFRTSVPPPAAAVAAPPPSDAVVEIIDQESSKLTPVVNLRWKDFLSGCSGRYSGSVNQFMRPHGRGRFISDKGESREGQWKNGVFLEVKSFPVAVSDAAMKHTDATRALRRQSSKSSASSLYSQSQLHEGVSYATSFHSSDYPNLQQQQQLDYEQAKEESTPVHFYCLGETIRSPQHMIQLPSVEDTIQSVYALQISDYVFVQRSSGEWTFCQLIEREDNEEGEDVMTFRVNEVGHRKSLRPARWAKMVRSCSKGVWIRPGGEDDSMEFEPSF